MAMTAWNHHSILTPLLLEAIGAAVSHSYRTLLVTCGNMGWQVPDSLSCLCSLCLTTGQGTSSAVWPTSAGLQDTATWCTGPSAMEQPASFLRAPQFTLILVRTWNPNRVPQRDLKEGREVYRRMEWRPSLWPGCRLWSHGIAAEPRALIGGPGLGALSTIRSDEQ